jgi:hypothetical protein
MQIVIKRLSTIFDAAVAIITLALFGIGVALVLPFYILYILIGFGIDVVKDKK